MKHRIHLSTRQLKRIHDGHAVVLKHHHLAGGNIEIELPEHHTKRISSAIRRGKGMKFHLTPEEIEGSGIKSFFKKTWSKTKDVAKKGWEGYKKHVKPHVAPIIKKGLTDLAQLGVHALTEAAVAAQPELAPEIMIAGEYASHKAPEAVEWLGKHTGGWGAKRPKGAYGIKRVGYRGH